MAKKRKVIKRKTRRKVFSKANIKPINTMVNGVIYGYIRGNINSFVQQKISPVLPFGEYSDEVAFSLASYYLARKGKKFLGVDLKKVGQAGLVVEGALFGNQTSQRLPLNISGITGMFNNEQNTENTNPSVIQTL